MVNRIISLFSGKTQSPKTSDDEPCDIRKVKETSAPLARSEAEQQAYQTWRATVACSDWKKFIKTEQSAFAKRCKMADCTSLIKFEQSKCCQQFKIQFDKNTHHAADFPYLLDLFRDILLENGYQLHTSDVRTYHCSETKKETIERHYLKPKPQMLEGKKLDQIFGNVTLTLHAKNGVPDFLMCRCTHYRDLNLYQPVRPMREIFDYFV